MQSRAHRGRVVSVSCYWPRILEPLCTTKAAPSLTRFLKCTLVELWRSSETSWTWSCDAPFRAHVRYTIQTIARATNLITSSHNSTAFASRRSCSFIFFYADYKAVVEFMFSAEFTLLFLFKLSVIRHRWAPPTVFTPTPMNRTSCSIYE